MGLCKAVKYFFEETVTRYFIMRAQLNISYVIFGCNSLYFPGVGSIGNTRAAQTQDPDFAGRFRDYAQTYRLPEGE